MGDPLANSDTDEKIPTHTWHENQDYVFQNYNPEFKKAKKASKEQKFDWVRWCAMNYTDEIVAEASTWQKVASHAQSNRSQVAVNIDTLNADQAFVYRAVVEHDNAWQQRTPLQAVGPFVAMVNGTAGSGKTYLIHALLDYLGERVITAAPTGVAADNIGGATYHSLFKIPCWGDLWRTDIVSNGTQAHLNELLRERSPKLEYVIFDEMSMMGKRQLGQIDHMMRHGTGNLDQPFGGLNVIFFGDHGQLPPVKDERCFSWAKCKYERSSPDCKCHNQSCPAYHAGDWKVGVQHWHREGLKAYEHVSKQGNVFYLKTIERCKGEGGRHEQFRDVQLALRDGESNEGHHAWLWKHCSKAAIESRGEIDSFANATRLVCTKKMRDQVNAEAAEAMIEGGAPSLVVHATDTDARIGQHGEGNEDSVRFLTELTLCVGMEVMVNKNLCVKHGLVNGTRGTVHDIIVNKNGMPVAVMLAVKQRSSTSGGYSGPVWEHGSGGGPVPEGCCLVAIPQDTEKVFLDGAEHTRTQFPLMPASALTVHKAQGLTLDKVIFDPGDSEPNTSVGVFFVGLTRVRDPHDLMLVRGKGFPSLGRLLEVNNKKSLIDRHNHEVRLWNLYLKLCSKLAHLSPGPAMACSPPLFRKRVSEAENKKQKEMYARYQQGGHTKRQVDSPQQPSTEKRAKVPTTPTRRAKAPTTPPRRAKAPTIPTWANAEQAALSQQPSTQRRATGPARLTAAQQYLQHHQEIVTQAGMLWPVGVLFGQYVGPEPAFACNATQRGALLKFRIVDFWASPEQSQAGQVLQFLKCMFPNAMCQLDTPSTGACKHQIGSSCGMVAASAVGCMLSVGGGWWDVDLSKVVDMDIIKLSNAAHDWGGDPQQTWMLEGGHVTNLVGLCSGMSHVELVPRFCYTSYDQCLASLVEGLRDFCLMPGITQPPKFIVSNTDLSTQFGHHWFTVAYQLTWQ